MKAATPHRFLGVVLMLAGLLAFAGDGGVDNRGSDTEQWWDKLPRAEWSQFERLDDGNGWFEIYRISARVVVIYEPGQFEEVISFLILGDERALLFDSGLGIGDMQAVLNLVWEQVIDYTVADSNEVAISRRFYPELRVAFDLSPAEALAWAFPPGSDDSLVQKARQFLYLARESGSLQALHDAFYNRSERLDRRLGGVDDLGAAGHPLHALQQALFPLRSPQETAARSAEKDDATWDDVRRAAEYWAGLFRNWLDNYLGEPE